MKIDEARINDRVVVHNGYRNTIQTAPTGKIIGTAIVVNDGSLESGKRGVLEPKLLVELDKPYAGYIHSDKGPGKLFIRTIVVDPSSVDAIV